MKKPMYQMNCQALKAYISMEGTIKLWLMESVVKRSIRK